MTEEEFLQERKRKLQAGKIKAFFFGLLILIGIIHGIITAFQVP